MFKKIFAKAQTAEERYNPRQAYQRHLDSKFAMYGEDRDLAFADAVGSVSVELFEQQGDAHVEVLKHHGLADGMAIYDLGCGCGRTAQALKRSGWLGRYIGTDVLPDFVAELRRKCPDYEAFVHSFPSVLAEDGSLDMLFHWSVFTHMSPEECYLLTQDAFRALRPGGTLVFSFLELRDPHHAARFYERAAQFGLGIRLNILDSFLHRDWIIQWSDKAGFVDVDFCDGTDETRHPPFWQTLASMRKPVR